MRRSSRMCSVIGYAPLFGGLERERELLFRRLLEQSLLRGVHALGIAQYDSRYALTWTKTHDLAHLNLIAESFDPCHRMIAHCRYSTSGDWQDDRNNQPIVVDDVALVFNGVISMKTRDEFNTEFGVQCESDNDGEILVRKILAGESPSEFVREMIGSFAGLWLRDTALYALRNERRPLWASEVHGAVWLASTRDIFARAGVSGAIEMPVGELRSW